MINKRYSVKTAVVEERWENVFEFPAYSVSDCGRVVNASSGNLITPTRNTRGQAIVGLMKNGIQCKRSLTLLVANAFVPHEGNSSFDTPINLDGDRMNNNYTNLKWRPLWFARKYHRQFTEEHLTFDAPIEDVETGEVYQSSMEASIVNGVLDSEIYLAMLNNTYVWPTGQVFREVV